MTSGNDAPWAVMYDTLVETLHRTRSVHQLKLSLEQVLAPAVPTEFLSVQNLDNKWRNVHKTARWGTVVIFDVDPFSDCFWMRADREVPVPYTSRDGYVLADDHPHFAEIKTWFNRAVELEESLEYMRSWLHTSMRGLVSYEGVQSHLPEILPYLAGVRDMASCKGTARIRSFSPSNDAIRNSIKEQLALGALCPATELNAWVGEPEI